MGAEVSSTGNSWQVECVSPSGTERPLPILDPFGERRRDKVCRKSTSVTTGRLPGWSSIGQTSHAPRRERKRYSKCCVTVMEILLKPMLLGRLLQLCELCKQVYCLDRLPWSPESAPGDKAKTLFSEQLLGHFCWLTWIELITAENYSTSHS